MAGWGVMMGLGQSLQQVGGMVADYNKDKMRAQLELEREERQEARDKAKEDRQLLKWNGQKPELVQEDNQWYQVRYRNDGEVFDKTEAPANIIQAATRDAEISDLKLTRAQQEVDMGAISLENAPELSRLALEDKRASIAARQAQAEASRASASRSRALAAGGGRSGSSKGSSSSDPRTAGLDKYTIETFFSRTDPEGEPIRDDEGNVQIDYNKLERYMSSPEYQTAKDKTAGVARYLQRTVPAERAERTSSGASAGWTGGELEQYIRTGKSPSTKAEKADPDEVGKIQQAERTAITLIDQGRLTVEEAAKQMEERGYPRAAARLRARYGN